jgi:PKD repeat protein
MKARLSALFVLGAFALGGCTVHQTEAPGLTGPSDLALSMRLTALPDTINQDGGSQSSIQVTAFGPDGKAKGGLSLRMDMMVEGQPQDYGTLSGRTIVTNSSGVASVIYTAPPSPVGGIFGTCRGLAGNCVTIVATPSGSGFESASPQSVSIRLVPTGVIQPAQGPVPNFTFTPSTPGANSPVQFDASTSCGGPLSSGACPGTRGIAQYSWNFGDGSSATGRTASHSFASQQTYTVTLTITNDLGNSASAPKAVTIGAGSAPTADFVFSPSAPIVNQPVNFDASQARAGAGHSIANYAWNFGDGASRTGVNATHDFGSAGTFNVTLTVTDEAGQATTVSKAVSVVSTSGGGGATSATFTFSPLTPSALQPVFFNASGSSAATGHTLTTYAWNFGDGSLITASTASITHTFASAGTFTVALTVTDDIGQQGRVTVPVTVMAAGAGSLTADFSISPTDPRSGQLVSFNANLSSPVASITSYDWDFGDGTVVNGQSSFLITHTYFTPTGNSYNIRLTVHDNTGRVATTVKNLTVIAGTDPTAVFTVSQSPTTVGTVITFDGALSTAVAPKTIVRYTWDFGDGSAIVSTTAPATSTTHAYAAAGTYVIRLTVTDSAGLTGATTRTLLVQ